ncbi:hypothetical protein WAI453_008814 [Rhynchosporium graminicola]
MLPISVTPQTYEFLDKPHLSVIHANFDDGCVPSILYRNPDNGHATPLANLSRHTSYVRRWYFCEISKIGLPGSRRGIDCP